VCASLRFLGSRRAPQEKDCVCNKGMRVCTASYVANTRRAASCQDFALSTVCHTCVHTCRDRPCLTLVLSKLSSHRAPTDTSPTTSFHHLHRPLSVHCGGSLVPTLLCLQPLYFFLELATQPRGAWLSPSCLYTPYSRS